MFSLTKSFKHLSANGGYSCVAHYNTKVNNILFNRKYELAKFTNAFNANPELHIILGPPSTGKTTLVREIMNKGNFNPLFINCRKGQFDTPERIYDSIYSQFSLFFDNHKDFLKRVKREQFSANYADFNVRYKLGKNRAITSNDVTRLLDIISAHLPNWSFWNDCNIPPPILIIDEANMFSQLAKNNESLLKSILSWLVLNTKEEKRFHVVLTSSNSFFLNWIINILHVPHVTPYIVGDLSKKEAEEYFEEHVLPQYECKELKGKVDHVSKITGTRMLIIDRYVKEYKNNEEKLEDNEFSIFRIEDDRLLFGLEPVGFLGKSDPLWNKDDLIKVMKAIVEAENQGFILELDLVKKIGRKKVYSLIEYNFLYRRPTNNFANDINPPNEIVLTAMNQPSLCAMKRLLKFL